MTKRDLFRILIKIFGLYSIINVTFSALPNNVFFVFREIDIIGIAWFLITLIVIILLFLFMIYKPDKIINWFKFDKGFDEDRIDFQNFNNINILKLAVIIVGGITLIYNIPVFLSNTFFAFKSSLGKEYNTTTFPYGNLRDYIHWTTSSINMVIGYLMLTNYNYIIKILKEKDKEKDKDETIINEQC